MDTCKMNKRNVRFGAIEGVMEQNSYGGGKLTIDLNQGSISILEK